VRRYQSEVVQEGWPVDGFKFGFQFMDHRANGGLQILQPIENGVYQHLELLLLALHLGKFLKMVIFDVIHGKSATIE
jgi:hypothetical protein